MKDTVPVAQRLVPLHKCVVAPENPRSNETVDLDLIAELADNIEAFGILTPLIGYAGLDGVHYVTAGGRRLRAAQHLQQTVGLSIEIPMQILDHDEAVEAGVAEQVTHQRLSLLDELKIFALPRYAEATNDVLAKRIGKSARYVEQQRKILDLPESVLSRVMGGEISVDQAAGLTYFIGSPEMGNMADAAVRRGLTGGDLRRMFIQSGVSEWTERNPFTKFVTVEDYEAAGGRLQTDLFSETKIILDPAVLEECAKQAITDAVFRDYAGRTLVFSEDIWKVKTFPGVYNLTEEEAATLSNLEDIYYNLRELADATEEDGVSAEDIAQAKEQIAQYDALSEKEYAFPDDLTDMLEVHWAFSFYVKTGYKVVENVLPADLTPLIDAGYIEPPKEAPAPVEGEPAPDDSLSSVMMNRILRIKMHGWRNLLISKPDKVLSFYALTLLDKAGTRFAVSPTPDALLLQTDDLPVSVSKAMGDVISVADAARSAENVDLKPTDVKKIIALSVVNCLTANITKEGMAHIVGMSLEPTDIRAVFTPDAAFMKGYKTPALVAMLPEGVEPKDKKSDLIEQLLECRVSDSAWLPAGF